MKPVPPTNVLRLCSTPCAEGRASLVERSDDALMQLASAGVDTAFEVLIRRHEGSLRAYCARRCGAGKGDEVAQEAFLALWDARHHYEPRGQLRALLFTIAERKARNVARTARRAHDRDIAACAGGPADPSTPLDTLLDQERQRRLHESLAKLSDEQRQAILLRYAAGLEYDEMAVVTARPAATLRQRVFVGLQRLRSLVPGRGDV